jgi:hypothetical protein
MKAAILTTAAVHETTRSIEYRCGMSRVAKLLEEIKQLPEEERALLRAELDELDESESAADIDPAFRVELEARLRSIENGTAVLLDGDAVMAELRAKYAAR